MQKCDPFDCGAVNSTTCVRPSRTNVTGITQYEAQGWYGVWNVWSLHSHIGAWATALDEPSSEHAILTAIDPRVANTATSVLMTLLQKYSINPNADAATRALLTATAKGNEMAYGNVRVRGESSTLSGTEWRRVLWRRLDQALGDANAPDGFDTWLSVVKGGAFSTRGLSGAEALIRKLSGSSWPYVPQKEG